MNVFTSNDGEFIGSEAADRIEISERDESKEDNILLLYKAKQNVRERRNLKVHVIAFFIALLVLGTIHAVFDDMYSEHLRRADDVVNYFNTEQVAINTIVESALVAESVYEYAEPVRSTVSISPNFNSASNSARRLRSYFVQYTHPVFYVFIGAMLAWGGWIAFRAGKMFMEKRRPIKKDLVLQEFYRLKKLNSE